MQNGEGCSGGAAGEAGDGGVQPAGEAGHARHGGGAHRHGRIRFPPPNAMLSHRRGDLKHDIGSRANLNLIPF